MFTTIETAREFALAGNALLTLSSLRTGQHFTYQVRQAKPDPARFPEPTWFVKLLTDGSADEGTFTYLGMIRIGKAGEGKPYPYARFTLTQGSKTGNEAPSVKAFKFFMEAPALHPLLEIRHEGRCGRCGRTLTVPSSIDAGIGPECASKMAGF